MFVNRKGVILTLGIVFYKFPLTLYVIIIVLFVIIACHSTGSQKKVLIVQDEMPQMEVLARTLREKGNFDVTVVDQATMPDNLSSFSAVIAFIHHALQETTEMAIIAYTKNGGRFITLHHSISSGKVENKFYFDFLGIRLDNPKASRNPVKPGGGYGWRNDGGKGITLTLVNLNPKHYITSHKVNWSENIAYTPSDFPSGEGLYPSISLENSEVYLNHKFIDGREKIVLCGFKFYDDRNGHLFMQDRAAWIKKQGKGEIIYFMPGHSPSDYKNPNVSRIILNAIEWLPEK